MAKNDRFKKVYTQGSVSVAEVWVDRETGVNYLFCSEGSGGGLTVLVDKDGKPIVSEDYINEKIGFFKAEP